jgi:hypothetical protein
MRERGHPLLQPRAKFPMAAQLLSDNPAPALFLPYRRPLARNGRKLMHHLAMSSAARPRTSPSRSKRVCPLLRDLGPAARPSMSAGSSAMLRACFLAAGVGSDDPCGGDLRTLCGGFLAVLHTVERVASPGGLILLIYLCLLLCICLRFLAPFKARSSASARRRAGSLPLASKRMYGNALQAAIPAPTIPSP